MRSARLPEPFVFYVDECIKCAAILDVLEAGRLPDETIQVMPKGTLDEAWLEIAGKAGWLCLSKDRRMLHNPNELDAIMTFSVGLFTVSDASSAVHAQLLAAGLPVIRRVARRLKRPFVARIDKSGDMVVSYNEGARLSTPTRISPTRAERDAGAAATDELKRRLGIP